TLTDSALGAALGTLAVLITSEVLTTLDAAAIVKPYLLTNYWLSWIDFFREPIFWHNIQKGLLVQAAYLAVFLGAAWANLSSKDITS
ncbi:MAG TPA: ABC transporter permease, partial [Pseudonocardiaceae bacterium]|nr:ABC transporter permease [Pseudonocardiaceae bacterium]